MIVWGRQVGIGLGVARAHARVRKLACFGNNREFCSRLRIDETRLRYLAVLNLRNSEARQENKVSMG